jgi:hypothetical protein
MASHHPLNKHGIKPGRQTHHWLGLSLLGALLAIAPVKAQSEAGSTQPSNATTNTSGTELTTAENTAGAKGAKVYCFMRSEGSTHNVSWDAAYALIKRQSSSLFKTSPEHAAVMITEAVVNNPAAYPDCGKYLGNLYAK